MINNKFDNIFSKKYPACLIRDGIVNEALFNKSALKILWVLKAPNDPKRTSWCLRECIAKDSKGRSIWNPVIRVSYALLNNINTWSQLPDIDLMRECLKKIAVINIKKSGEDQPVKEGLIKRYYQQYRKDLLEQITDIHPDIIINASRIKELFEDLKTGCQQRDIKSVNRGLLPFSVAKNGKRILIDAYSPQARCSREKYFNSIIQCYMTGKTM